ncbi:hypothetical protein AGMMS49991_00140 [Spirochaetia bacterium]|nr:hypothetical protein AGMMS49991_00140 [Spirochaetia bacterium]
MNLQVIDIIFAALILIITIRSFLRGLIEELLSMASVVLGLAAAFFLHKNGGVFLAERFKLEMKILPDVLAFVGIFLIVFAAVKLLEFILRDIVARINLDPLDHFLGAVFGVIEGLMLVSLILWILTVQPLFNPQSLLENSLFAQLLLPFIGELRFPGEVIPEQVPALAPEAASDV